MPAKAPAKPLTKTALIELLAKDSGLDKNQAKACLEALTAHIHKTIKKGGVVKLDGLGQFKVRASKARMGRNPGTGEAIKIKARKNVKFYVSKTLKDLIAPKKK